MVLLRVWDSLTLSHCHVAEYFFGVGSLAAIFQSFMYGAFTPAGGIFATLTSMAMLGTLMWPAAIISALLATGVAIAVYAYGVGR